MEVVEGVEEVVSGRFYTLSQPAALRNIQESFLSMTELSGEFYTAL